MSDLQKQMYPSLRQLEGWKTPLFAITTGKQLALPDISYYLSQRRYLIHVCIVRKELKIGTLMITLFIFCVFCLGVLNNYNVYSFGLLSKVL